jgi:hypothetical protein
MGHMEVGAPRLYGEANSLTNRVAWPFHFSYYLRFTPKADICTATRDVRYGPLADEPFWPSRPSSGFEIAHG